MKQPKKLTRNQKACLSANSLDWREWKLIDETDLYLQIIHKETGVIKTIDKSKKGRR